MRSKSTFILAFLGLKELARKFGLGDFDIKVFRMAPKAGGKSVNFAITTDDQWKLELPSLLDGTGSEMNSMYSKCICIVCQVVQKSYWVRLCVLNILVPIFHAIYDVIDTYLSLRYICYNYCGPVYIKLNFEALRVLRRAICSKITFRHITTHHVSK